MYDYFFFFVSILSTDFYKISQYREHLQIYFG